MVSLPLARRTQSFRKGLDLELPRRGVGAAHQRQPRKQLAKVWLLAVMEDV